MLKLLETVPLASLVLDNNLDIVYANELALNLFGCNVVDLLNKKITSFFSTIDFSIELETEAYCTYNNFNFQNKLHLQFVKTQQLDYYGVVYLSKNKESHLHLYNTLKSLETYIDTCENGVLVFDNNACLQFANATISKHFNLNKDDYNASYIWDFFNFYANEQDWNLNKVELENSPQCYTLHDSISSKGEKHTFSVTIEALHVDIDLVNYIVTYNDITDATKKTNDLVEKNRQLNMFHKNIPAVIFQFVIESSGIHYFSFVSDSFSELFGFQLPIHNVNWSKSFTARPKKRCAFLEAMHRATASLSELHFVDEVILPSGKSSWFEINAIPSQSNSTTIFNGIVLDVNQRVELENSHLKTNEFNNSVLFNIPADIAVFDSSHRYLFINANAIANADTRNWLIGKTDFEYCDFKGISTTLAEERRQYFERARDTHQQVDWIDEITKNGEKVFVLRRFFPFYKGDEFVYMIGYGIDITELRRAQNRLSKTERQNELILKAAPDGVIMMDNNWNITFWNPKAVQIFGWKSDEVLGENLSEVLFRNKDKKIVKESLFFDTIQFNNSVINKTLELKAYTKEGRKFPVELSIVPIDENDNEFNYCIFLRDITERKEKEQEIEKQNKQLINKNKELEQITYIASHDLQEPLLTLTTYCQLLNEEFGGALGGEGDIFINFITKSATRMRLLILCLMQYARISKLENTVTVDFDAIVNEVLLELEPMIAESKAVIQLGNSVTFDCYPIHIKSLMENLISNAIKFSQKKGKPSITIHSEERNEDYLFKVSDNGIGIEPKNRDQIFLIFKRLHHQKEYVGQGIGLAHCKKIVEIHQGEIWVESDSNTGSTFYFTISKKIK